MKYQKRKYDMINVCFAWFALVFMIFELFCVTTSTTKFYLYFHSVWFLIQAGAFWFQTHCMKKYSRPVCEYPGI